MLGPAGVNTIVSRIAGPIVISTWPVTPPCVALIVDTPGANPVVTPAVETVATEGVADTQVTWPVRS